MFDVAIIGAGIVGLAAAREILSRRPGTSLVVLDKESEIGRHQTGHNSGVIHSGIYYAPGSVKAKACVAGAASIKRYAEEHSIPFEECGKVIVATSVDELPRLHALYQRGVANGVPGLERIGAERIRELEPHCVGIAGLWSPKTGVIDFGRIAASYADDVRKAGGTISVDREVIDIRHTSGSVVLVTAREEVEAKRVIACAGLYADRVAALTGAPRDPRIVPFRGDYYVLPPERRHLVNALIYPVPDPSFPFLGVHFTRRIDGEVWLGPNAVLAFSREGYGRTDLKPADLAEALAFSGFRKLATRYWRMGLDEMWRDYSRSAYLKSLQVYMPEMVLSDLLPGPSGVRAQALASDGKLVDDFVVDTVAGVLHVRNAPSPAATASLAIGAMIADALDQTE
jgi:(S)-2-hydroxyglutarate dehydrogenase